MQAKNRYAMIGKLVLGICGVAVAVGAPAVEARESAPSIGAIATPSSHPFPKDWLLIEAPLGFDATSNLAPSVKRTVNAFARKHQNEDQICVESARGDDQYVTSFMVKISQYLNRRYNNIYGSRNQSSYDDPKYTIPWGYVLLVTTPCYFVLS